MKKNITRRNFVKTTIVATAGLPVMPLPGRSRIVNPFDAKGLPTRALGHTGVQVPLLGFGCGSRWGAIEDLEKAHELLEYALDNGLYYWDTAAQYGGLDNSSEEKIGKILPRRRNEVFLVSKVHEREGDKAKELIERSLKRLNTDYIDLLHVHSVLTVEDAEKLGEKGRVLQVLHDYRDQGIVKHIGFTGHTDAEGMKRAAELYDFEVMMIAMNHHQQNKQRFEEQAVPFAANKGLGVVAMKVIRPRETVKGLSAETLIRYALSSEYFSLANIGMDSLEVLKSNIELIRDFQPLKAQEMNEVSAALTPFFQHKHLAWMNPSYLDGITGTGNLRFLG